MTPTPNILIIMADQLVADLTGAYGHPVVRTPNLERLVQSGIRFDAAYCTYPVCSPSRSSLLSGRFASRNSAWDNAAPVASDIPMLPHYLATAGYETALSGKMHFVGPDQLHGFEKRLTTDMFPGSLAWTPQREGPAPFVHPGNPDGPPIAIDYVNAGPVQWNEQLQFDEETHYRALEYIRSKRTDKAGSMQVKRLAAEDPPWLLVASYHHPHEPFQPPQRYWDLYDGAEIDPVRIPAGETTARSVMDEWVDVLHGSRDVDLEDPDAQYRMRRAYYALVTYIDDKVGELLDALEATGVAENTVVIFTSDHGDMLGERGMVQKRVFYEWSARVPLIIGGAPLAVAGQVCETPVSLLDILPTLCELTGTMAIDVSGQSLMPLIDQRSAERDPVFVEYHSEGVYAPCFMRRDGRYKYVYVHGHDDQLFDLHTDPLEQRDLSALPEYAHVVDEAQKHVLATFDPDDIEGRIAQSLQDRSVIREAMMRTGTRWDYQPHPGLFTAYWHST